MQSDGGNKEATKGVHHCQLQISADSLEPSQYREKSFEEYE